MQNNFKDFEGIPSVQMRWQLDNPGLTTVKNRGFTSDGTTPVKTQGDTGEKTGLLKQ